MTERIDPALTKGNGQQLACYRATHFKWEAARGDGLGPAQTTFRRQLI